MAVDNFKVSLASKDVMREYVMACTQKISGSIGKMDSELFWAAGPEGAGVYVGELDGELVTGIAMIQHNESYCWVGSYYCEEHHRGNGFAFKTWQMSRAVINQKANIGLDAAPSGVQLYEKSGFKRVWDLTFCSFHVSSIIEVYRNTSLADISTKPATEVDFAELQLYTEDVIGIKFAQAGLLEKYITLPTHVAVVAVSRSGNIVGLAVIRECHNSEKQGYRLAPLLADTGDIARLLLLQLAKKVDLSQKFNICVLDEINPEAERIADEMKGEKITDLVRMYTGEDPPIKKEKYFGEFSPELAG
jgi:ribosomal-protein-alanine N-acetyltransferase